MGNNFTDTAKANSVIIRAMLGDDEFMCGGIFSREAYYMKKYGLTQEQMSEMQTNVWLAVTAGYER